GPRVDRLDRAACVPAEFDDAGSLDLQAVGGDDLYAIDRARSRRIWQWRLHDQRRIRDLADDVFEVLAVRVGHADRRPGLDLERDGEQVAVIEGAEKTQQALRGRISRL